MPVGDLKPEGMNQMEPTARQGAHPADIPGVLRDLGLKKDEVQHINLQSPHRFRREPNLIRSRPPLQTPPVSFTSDKALVIVDDEKSYADLLAQLLTSSLRCPIKAYTRPLDALAAVPGLNAGLVVTDYYMPGINGLEFIRRLHGVAPDVPVVMITGHMMELAETGYADLPMLKAILAKPFSWRLLAEEIVRHWPEPGLRQPAAASL